MACRLRRRNAAAYRVRAGCALLYPGPLCSGGRVEDQPAGWLAWMQASLASGQDALSTNPGARPRTFRAGMPGKRVSGVAFSLVPFSWPLKRKELALRKEDESSCSQQLRAKREERSRAGPSPTPPINRGGGTPRTANAQSIGVCRYVLTSAAFTGPAWFDHDCRM